MKRVLLQKDTTTCQWPLRYLSGPLPSTSTSLMTKQIPKPPVKSCTSLALEQLHPGTPPHRSHARAKHVDPMDPLLMLHASLVPSWSRSINLPLEPPEYQECSLVSKARELLKGCIVNRIGIWSWENSSLYPTQLNHPR